jgi:hypothetical protein
MPLILEDQESEVSPMSPIHSVSDLSDVLSDVEGERTSQVMKKTSDFGHN